MECISGPDGAGTRWRARVGGLLAGVVLLLIEVVAGGEGGGELDAGHQDCVEVKEAASIAASSSRRGLSSAGWGGSTGWAPAVGDEDPWLLLDAGVYATVLGVATRGSGLSSFRVHSGDGSPLANESGSATFLVHGAGPVESFFATPVSTRYVKVFPTLGPSAHPPPLRVALLVAHPECGARAGSSRRLASLVDECSTGAHTCSNLETCVDTTASFVCTCNAGYSHVATLDGTAGQAMSVLNSGTVDGGGFSIALWIYVDTTVNAQDYPPLVSCVDSATGNDLFTFTAGIVVGSSAFAYFTDGVLSTFGPFTPWVSKEWMFIGATWSQSADKVVFYTGAPGSTNWAKEQLFARLSLSGVHGKNLLCTLGKEGNDNVAVSAYMTGKVRRAFVWDTVLTDSQMESVFYTGMDVETQSVIARLDAGNCEAHDECGMTGLNRCSSGTTCVEQTNEYSCSCKTGYARNSTYVCTEVDECSTGVHICDSNAKCNNTDGAFTCACNSGYAGNGISCSLPAISCPSPARSGVDSCYVVQTGDKIVEFMTQDRKTKSEANAICEAESGRYVASITNGDEQAAFKAKVENQGETWIGITCTGNELQTCTWDDGSTETYDPSDDGFELSFGVAAETCARMRDNGAWWDHTCDQQFHVACSQKATTSGANITCEASTDTGNYACTCSSDVTTCEDALECSVSATRDRCAADPKGYCSNTVGSFSCACNSGYLLASNGRDCENVNECTSGSHNCATDGGKCTDTEGSFTCACNAGYSGSGTSCTRDPVDECSTGAHNCGTQATCVDSTGSFTCACNTAGYGPLTDLTTCPDWNECSSTGGPNNCNAQAACTNTEGSFTCACNAGYSGDGIAECANVDECTTNAHNCGTQATCVDSTGSFTCACNTAGYGPLTDLTTCPDWNECSSTGGPNNCNAQAACNNTEGSFTCACNAGYSGDGIAECANVDECTTNAHNCGTRATCVDSTGSFTCACNAGYGPLTDLTTCPDWNECTGVGGNHSCPNTAICNNTEGSYTCVCGAGYSGSGATCTNINECFTGAHNCGTRATCVDSTGSFTCACNTAGYGPLTDLTTCPDWNECSSTGGPNNCNAQAACNNTEGSFTCACNAGWSGDGVACTNINECDTSSLCASLEVCSDTIGSFVCVCARGYTDVGGTCQDKDECAQGGGHDCHSDALCSNTNGSFTCACNAGYSANAGTVVGTNCSNVDECSGGGVGHSCSFSQATCADTVGSFACGCNKGYSFEGSGKGNMSCSDVDECAVQPSANASCAALRLSCLNNIGSFECTGCQAGYEFNGTRCVDIDECARGTDTCAEPPGGICNNTAGSFNCSCAPLYTPVQGQCVNTNVPQASPAVCPTGGDTTVTILMPSAVFGSVLVRFSEGGTGVTATLVNQGGKELTATCPSLSAPVSQGKGQVYTPGGDVLGTFDFDYTVPPPTLTPSRLPIQGGTISLSVYAALPSGCIFKFGDAAAAAPTPATSSSIPSVVSIVVPPTPVGAGTATVSISCLGGAQQAYVTYVDLPTVSSAQVQGRCETLSPCTVIATVSNPPSTMATADDVSLSLSGLSEVAGGGSARTEVLSVGGSSAVLRITTPAFLSAGVLRGAVAPVAAPSGFSVAQATAPFNLTVSAALVIVTSLSPLSGSAAGGTTVRITVTGLPPLSPAPSVWFGGVAVTGAVTVVVSDLDATILNVATPAAGSAGTVFVSVGTLRNAMAHDSGGFFAYQSAGVSATCVACEVGVQGGAGVTVALTGFGGAASAISVTVVDGGTPSTITSLSGGLASITFPPWTAGGSVNGLVPVFAAISEGTRTAYAQFYYRTPPTAVGFTFSSDGSRAYLVFDQRTNTPACAPLLAPLEDRLGNGWSCAWSESDKLTLTLVFGSGAALGVGDTLIIPANAVADEKGITVTSGGGRRAAGDVAVNASAPAFPISPTITVTSPTDVGTCDTVLIEVEGASPRPMTYVWRAPLDASLDAVLLAHSSGSISLPASALPRAEVKFEITVTAVTFLGGTSEPRTITIAKRALPPPLVSILFPAGPMYTTASNDITASAEFSACLLEQAPVNFAWSLTAAPPPASASNPEILNSSTSTLTIPPGVLTPGTTYHLRLFALQSGSGSTSVETTVALERSPLKASILGGSSRTVGTANTVTLDASSSLDPDTCPPPLEGEPQAACGDASLGYSWSCKHTLTGDPCRLKANSASVAIAGTAVTSLDISIVTPPPEGGLTVACEVSKGTRTASAAVELALVEGEVIDVDISVVKHSATRLSLRGGGSPDGYRWGMTGAGLVASGSAAEAPAWSTEALVSTGWGSESFGLQIMDAVDAGVLLAGATYTVTLSAGTASGAQGGCSFSFMVGLPPSGGTCALVQASGFALQTDIRVQCKTWSTDALPLSYSFGFAPAGGEVNWMPRSFKSTGSFRLQSGSYNASTRVYDSDGMWATAPSGAVLVSDPVLADGQTVEGAIGGAAEYMDGLGQDSGMTMVAGSVAAGLYDDTCAAEGTCGGRRRLLASSAAYRMRVRRLLLAKMGGGAGKGVSTKSVGSVLSTVSSLSSAPDEVGAQGAQDSVSMLASSAKSMLSDQLRSGGLVSTVGLCDSTVGLSQRMQTPAARDRVLREAAHSAQTCSAVLVRSMTSDEAPFNATFASIGVWLRRLRRADTEVSLATFFNSSFVVRSPNGVGGGSRRVGADGAGFIASYIAGTWAPLGDSVAQSHTVGLFVVNGGPVAPPLSDSVTNYVPKGCPASEPMCVTVTLRIPLPDDGITQVQVGSGSFTRCLWWQATSDRSDIGHKGQWRQNCTHVETEVRGGGAHVKCLCPTSGYYHADLVRPAPRIRENRLAWDIVLSRYVHLWVIYLSVGICLALFVPVVGIAVALRRSMLGSFEHLSSMYRDAHGSLSLAGKQPVMQIESDWRQKVGMPSSSGETVLFAEYGILRGETAPLEALPKVSDAGFDVVPPPFSTNMWGAGGEKESMVLRRKRMLEDRAQWENRVKTGEVGIGAIDALVQLHTGPKPSSEPASLFKRILSRALSGSSTQGPTPMHHARSQQRKGSLLHHTHSGHQQAHTKGMVQGYSSFESLQGSGHDTLHHETSNRQFVTSHKSSRDFDRGRRRSSIIQHMATLKVNFRSDHGVQIDHWEPPHSVPDQEGLWWMFPRPRQEESEEVFATHWVHWFGYADAELDVMPERAAAPDPDVAPDPAAALAKDGEDQDGQDIPIEDGNIELQGLESPHAAETVNPTEYQVCKRPTPKSYNISPTVSPRTFMKCDGMIYDLPPVPPSMPAVAQIVYDMPPMPPSMPTVAQIVKVGGDFTKNTPLTGHEMQHPGATYFSDSKELQVPHQGRSVADSSSSDCGSATAAETPKPRLFYVPFDSNKARNPESSDTPLPPLTPIRPPAMPPSAPASLAPSDDKSSSEDDGPDPKFATSPADYVLQMTAGRIGTPREDTEARPTGTGMVVNGVPVVGGLLLPGRSPLDNNMSAPSPAISTSASPPPRFGTRKAGKVPLSPDSWMIKQDLNSAAGGVPTFSQLDLRTQGSAREAATLGNTSRTAASNAIPPDHVSPFVDHTSDEKRPWGQPVDFHAAKAGLLDFHAAKAKFESEQWTRSTWQRHTDSSSETPARSPAPRPRPLSPTRRPTSPTRRSTSPTRRPQSPSPRPPPTPPRASPLPSFRSTKKV